MRKWLLTNWMQEIIFLGPAVLVYMLIIALPFVLNVYYSFTSWNGVSGNISWVGLDNFIYVLKKDANFGHAFWFTARFTVAVVALTNLVGFLLAYALTHAFKTRKLLRTVFFVPNVLGGLLLGFIWQFIFVQGFAAIGRMTHSAFFELPWLGTENTAFWALVVVFLWHGAGYVMVIYIAGLTNVPKDMIEAATIDGANRLQVLRSIILPLIMPITTVCLFLTISWAFKMFDINFSLTKGGPFNSTESVAMNIYNEAFVNNNYGLGTAKALLFFVAVAVITALQVSITKRKEVDL
ncbi:sn-glycerol-3-phosphate transport system permease protein UgpA [Paenibacillus konkukensis]|uniref:Sn-glycerol-3-phosphate transport system permease protein UgpA n=1 Tax=Paenibacillus konkukensis TaxID=2020716 RepID=A0ABY4RS89_9BACL|nr:sn-glycerol-3-phosphate transport system permease protein UgpA [Paenibacillus konkukensis]